MMEFVQELFVTACVAIVMSFVVAVYIAVSGGQQNIVDKKLVIEEVKSDKGLKVVSVKTKSKKRVKFADEVVVQNVDHFEGVEEPIKDIEISEEMSEKLGLLDGSIEGVIVGKKSEVAEIIQMVKNELEGKVDKESEVMLSGEELLKECDDMIREVNNADAELEKGSHNAELLDNVFEDDVFTGSRCEDIKVDEFCCLLGQTELTGVLESLGLAMEMNDDVATGQMVAEGGDKGTKSSEVLDEALDYVASEEKIRNPVINEDRFNGVKEGNFVAGGSEKLVFEEMIKSQGLGGDSEVKMVKDETIISQCEEEGAVGFAKSDGVGTAGALGKGNEMLERLVGNESIDIDDDDDWEGIERTELEKVFAEAVNYVEYGGKGKNDQLGNIANDVQMQLYGLHKLAIEGPCHEPQPMALKVSARAKWNAWQRLGSMNSDVAMEHYINLLSDTDPGWMQHFSADGGKHDAETGLSGNTEANLSFVDDIQAETEDESVSVCQETATQHSC